MMLLRQLAALEMDSGRKARQYLYASTGRFYMYEYAGFDPENGKMLYYTAAGTTVFQDALDANKDKKYTGSILPSSTYGVTLGANYRN
jgi:hypothetical protein